MDYRDWAHRFADIGAALTEARSLNELLETILTELRGLTSSDAGSIYRVIETGDGKQLRFESAQNDSIDLPDQRFTLPMDRSSIAGYCAVENEALNLSDVYDLPEDAPYSFSDDFDREHGYRTQSMLVVPLNNRHGETKGVLQLINRKADPSRPLGETEVRTYSDELQELITALSSQAAVAMERSELEESVETMLESMVQTLVTALDRRDEITTGHSRRLTRYAMEMVEAINESTMEPFKGVTIEDWEMNLLYYSGLLHDIGKIAVPESVLNKRNRLTDDRMEAIRNRLAYIDVIDEEADALSKFDRLSSINESGFLPDEKREWLESIRERTYEDPREGTRHWLTEEEFHHLSVKKGNLTPSEREQIQYHAEATHEILENIEWTQELERVPEIASMHHENLDGTGYPRGVEGEEIPLLARVLCVVDIFEALTARDRPYKPAMDPEKAYEILEEEAEAGHLDQNLVDLFYEQEIYELVGQDSLDF